MKNSLFLYLVLCAELAHAKLNRKTKNFLSRPRNLRLMETSLNNNDLKVLISLDKEAEQKYTD